MQIMSRVGASVERVKREELAYFLKSDRIYI